MHITGHALETVAIGWFAGPGAGRRACCGANVAPTGTFGRGLLISSQTHFLKDNFISYSF